MTTSTITVDDMREKLLTLDEVRERLAVTEPLAAQEFPLRGSEYEVAQFRILGGWNSGSESLPGTDPVDAYVSIGGGKEHQLTKEALLEATSFIGLTKKFTMNTPSTYIEPLVNYWYTHRDDDYQMLSIGDRAVGITRKTVTPFSNLRLLEEILEGIQTVYVDGEVLADYKMHHSLRGTTVRLIVPENVRQVRPDDTWSTGLVLNNSLTGEVATSQQGYLFRWWCTNGATSTHASGHYNRRILGQGDEVFEWARAAVEDILGGLEHEFEALEELANTPIPNIDTNPDDAVSLALTDLFETYKVPVSAREAVIDNMVNSDDFTMYGLMQSVTQAANSEDLSEPLRARLMDIGGDLPRANSERCAACRRLMP